MKRLWHRALWRLDACAKAWFGMRADLGLGWRMYFRVIGALLVSALPFTVAVIFQAPGWLIISALLLSAAGFLVAKICLVLCLEAWVASLSLKSLLWVMKGAVGPPVQLPFDYRERAAMIGWRVPRSVGLLEEAFLARRLSAKMESEMIAARLANMPRAKGKATSRRL